MSTPLVVLVVLVALVLFAVMAALGRSLLFGLELGLRLVIWMTARTITRASAGRPNLAVFVTILAAVSQGAIGAWIVYLITFVISDYAQAASFRHLLTIFAGMGAMFPATVLLRATEVAQNDSVAFGQTYTGPIVLFLRSFATEGLFHDETLFYLGINSGSEEEEVAELFAGSGLGEFVGLARPGQRFQELGAVRVEIGSADWHAEISRLVDRSTAVAMQLGDSDALMWEFDAIVRSDKLCSTLFLLPSAFDEDDLRMKYNTVLAKMALRSDCPALPVTLQAGARFLYFDHDGVAQVVVESETNPRTLADLLEPFFTQLGVAKPVPRPRHANFVGRIVGVFFILYFIAVYLLPKLARVVGLT